eukprot:s1856_g1.t1
MADLQPNPAGCQSFESNVFRQEKCRHCGLSWRQHAHALDSTTESRLRRAEEARRTTAAAKTQAKAKAQADERPRRRRARVEESRVQIGKDAEADELDMVLQGLPPRGIKSAVPARDLQDSTSRWFFGEAQDDAEESGSESDGEFRMFAGEDGRSAGPKIVNLVDFLECNPPATPSGPDMPVSSSSASASAVAAGSSEDASEQESAIPQPQFRSSPHSPGPASRLRDVDYACDSESKLVGWARG